MGLGIAAVILVWLVFSVLKKVVGLIFLAAVAYGFYLLWTDPALLRQVTETIQSYLP